MITSQQIMGLASDHTCEVNESHYLLPEVKTQFLNMQAAAAKEGHDLQICSSFRSFEKQLAIWNRKWLGELTLYDITGKVLQADELSDKDKLHAILTWSALPGASRHHWGTDFDVYDKACVEACESNFELVPSEYEGDGPCAGLSTWIQQHCHEFGFYLPYAEYVGGVAQEPWHLSFKKLAQKIQQQFRLTELENAIKASEMLGKDAVLKSLPELVTRYTYNKGNKTGAGT